jgi:hypothetical protein
MHRYNNNGQSSNYKPQSGGKERAEETNLTLMEMENNQKWVKKWKNIYYFVSFFL